MDWTIVSWRLLKKGLINVLNFKNQKINGDICLLTPQGGVVKALLTGQFLKRKMAEYLSIGAEIEALSADAPHAWLLSQMDGWMLNLILSCCANKINTFGGTFWVSAGYLNDYLPTLKTLL